jgi:putative membrane protein
MPDSVRKEVDAAVYKPIIMMKAMGLWVNGLRKDGKIDAIQQCAFDANLGNLSDITGGCERIASTPIPYTYAVLLHRTVYLYCFLLPFGFVDTLGWMTPLIVTFIAYTFIALEAIGDEIEEPFGNEPNDLALNQMTAMIENTLLEMDGRAIKNVLVRNQRIVD